MEAFEFYKGLFDREIQRRNDLDNALSIPVGMITILTAVISYIFPNLDFKAHSFLSYVIIILLIIDAGSMIIAVVFLSLSYNNGLKGHKYLMYNAATSLREYELQVAAYNEENKPIERIDYEHNLIQNLNRYTDNHIKINDSRELNLHFAKSALIISLFIVLITIILFIIKKYLL